MVKVIEAVRFAAREAARLEVLHEALKPRQARLNEQPLLVEDGVELALLGRAAAGDHIRAAGDDGGAGGARAVALRA